MDEPKKIEESEQNQRKRFKEIYERTFKRSVQKPTAAELDPAYRRDMTNAGRGHLLP